MTAGRVKEITSLANPLIKDLRALTQKKNREREGLFLTEGLKLVLEGLELGAKIRCIVYAESGSHSPLAEQAAARAYAAGALIIKANPKIMEAVSRRANPQNLIGVFEQQWQEAEALLSGGILRPQGAKAAAAKADAEQKPQPSRGRLFLALDRVRDPGNLGTIIRTADAAGADGIILLGETASPFALEAARATMGSIFALPLARASEAQFLSLMGKFRGLKVGAHLKGAVDYRAIAYFGETQRGGGKQQPHAGGKGAAAGLGAPHDVLLLMGNEQQGLTEALAQACDALARIPQAGRADSLNLAVSTGIMLFEICRGRLAL